MYNVIGVRPSQCLHLLFFLPLSRFAFAFFEAPLMIFVFVTHCQRARYHSHFTYFIVLIPIERARFT